ncbi:MAG: hypothetical protein L3K00_03330 [Thermoplasmata archaeon]|nr:hypothetical protein [Thermoplasmata archaeon]MCI4361631.1 hypothetical protein [Thermoplasmata archaeon]
MLLSGGESQLRREDVVPYRWGDATGEGSLYLTTFRLVLESPQGGRLRAAHTETVFDLPLRSVGNVSVGVVRGRARYIVLEFPPGKLRLDVVDPARWYEAIAAAKAELASAHAPVPRATHTVEREVVKIRCRHCGTLSDERMSRCASCGASL